MNLFTTVSICASYFLLFGFLFPEYLVILLTEFDLDRSAGEYLFLLLFLVPVLTPVIFVLLLFNFKRRGKSIVGLSFFTTLTLSVILLLAEWATTGTYFSPPCFEGWSAFQELVGANAALLAIAIALLSIAGIIGRRSFKVIRIVKIAMLVCLFAFLLMIPLHYHSTIVKGENVGPGCMSNIPQAPGLPNGN